MPKSMKTAMPPDFSISERVRKWAQAHGYCRRLDEHMEYFKLKAEANGYRYANWDTAFMVAIRDDWARLRQPARGGNGGGRNIEELARERGVEARRGEEMPDFIRRVMAARH